MFINDDDNDDVDEKIRPETMMGCIARSGILVGHQHPSLVVPDHHHHDDDDGDDDDYDDNDYDDNDHDDHDHDYDDIDDDDDDDGVDTKQQWLVEERLPCKTAPPVK